MVRYFKPLVYKEKALSRKRWGFLFVDRTELAQVRDKNKKTRQTPQADAGLFLCKSSHLRITSAANNPLIASALQGF
jgi:hypothetical protein